MNQDQVKGSTKEALGKAQREVGKALDSEEQRQKGAENQAEGQVQKTVGNVKDTFNK